MRKRAIALLAVFVLAFSALFGCADTGKGTDNATVTPPPPPDVSGVVFADKTVEYDGTVHSLAATSVPDGVTVTYENNGKKDYGVYDVKAKLYDGSSLLTTLSAKLTVKKKPVTVVIDDKSSRMGDATAQLTYSVSGVIAGDDLGINLSVNAETMGETQITGKYTNDNYAVTFTGGKYTVLPPDVSGAVFADATAEYDGQPHTLTATSLPSGVTAQYENNEHTDPGKYEATAKLYVGEKLIDTRTATLTVTEKIMDNLADGTTDNFVASLAPFALKDAVFSNYVVTSISFVYGGLANGLNANSPNLQLPVYVVKTDYSTEQADCTEQNGKKILLDFTGKLAGVNIGDTLTADGLHIEVGADETLAFGDRDMTVLPKYRKNDPSYGFDADIFTNNVRQYYGNSLTFRVSGYPTTDPDLSGVVFADKTDETDGTTAVSLTATNIPSGVRVLYENNTHNTAGVYTAKANLYRGLRLVKTLTATFTVKQCIMNNLADAQANVAFSPGWSPFALINDIFGGKIITSISFVFSKYADNINENSSNLNVPIYIVKSDFTTKQSECTVENGKKIILDFTGKLAGVKQGDTVTADNLNIRVESDETLAFGDSSMTVLPAYTMNSPKHGFKGKIFENNPPSWDSRSLTFKITGYPIPNDNPYISFLGDSISTYSGYSNNVSYNSTIGNNAVWFPNNNYTGANMAVAETWWQRTVTQTGYNLCVNNSWSGSVVKDAQTFNVRARNLHDNNGNKPDIIVMFMGVNDYAANTAVGSCDGTTPPESPVDFSGAYAKTVANIKDAYPDAQVFCCTFLPDRKRFSGGANGSNISETAYNDAIRTIARNMDCRLIDLYNDCGITADNIATYTVDRLHPNSAGMGLIANTVVSAITA